MNAKTNQPTVDVPGVTVFFPASVHFNAADAWLGNRGVAQGNRWFTPTSTSCGAPILVFYGGRGGN